MTKEDVMKIIKLTDEEINNLKVFLGRCDLKGNEVPAFIAILNKINNPEVIEDGKQIRELSRNE
jgi:hypothetical protein